MPQTEAAIKTVRLALESQVGPELHYAIDIDIWSLSDALKAWMAEASRAGKVRGGELDPSLALCKLVMSRARALSAAVDSRPMGFCILVDAKGHLAFGQRGKDGNIQSLTGYHAFGALAEIANS